jgi:hypothetical protein
VRSGREARESAYVLVDPRRPPAATHDRPRP